MAGPYNFNCHNTQPRFPPGSLEGGVVYSLIGGKRGVWDVRQAGGGDIPVVGGSKGDEKEGLDCEGVGWRQASKIQQYGGGNDQVVSILYCTHYYRIGSRRLSGIGAHDLPNRKGRLIL